MKPKRKTPRGEILKAYHKLSIDMIDLFDTLDEPRLYYLAQDLQELNEKLMMLLKPDLQDCSDLDTNEI